MGAAQKGTKTKLLNSKRLRLSDTDIAVDFPYY